MTRSALKPLQAVPLVAAGGVERFGFSSEQVALLCASHSGEPRHVDRRRRHAAPRRLRARPAAVRRPSAAVLCRARRAAAGRRRRSRRCSTIARASTPGCWPIAGIVAYRLRPTWRSTIRCSRRFAQAVAHLTGVAEASLVAGIDGCSAPNYAVPLSALAFAYARLAGEPKTRATARRRRRSPRR